MKFDFVQFIVIYIMVGFSTYLREFVAINDRHKKNKSSKRKPKPSAKIVFGITTLSSVVLFLVNTLIIKWTDWSVILLALAFGWFGQDLAAMWKNDPYLFFELIPVFGKTWAEALRKSAKSRMEKKDEK